MTCNNLLQQKLRDYIQLCGSQNQAAKNLGKSAAMISTYLQNKYAGNVAELEKFLAEFFENKLQSELLKSAAIETAYKPTSISSSVYKTINICHLKGGLAIEAGDAGIGKTMACKKYADDHPNSAIYISVNPCLVTLSAFLKLLCRTQKLSTGTKDAMWQRLAESFEGEHRVIIVDEAQHLPIKTIEALRAFFDGNSYLGICLVGNVETVTNTGKSKEAFAQIRNRTRFTQIRHTKQIMPGDIQLLFPSLSGERELTFLLSIARSEQGIRGASNIYSNAVDNEDTSYSGLLAIAKAMKISFNF